MRIRMFYHSLASDWNNGHAHFLRGIVSELMSRGHDVVVYEPETGWSLANQLSERGGESALDGFRRAYPHLISRAYQLDSFDLDRELRDADLVIVHEWNPHELVRRIGDHRASAGYQLLFHDTHHRSVTEPATMASFDLSQFDGVLAYGRVIENIYLSNGWAKRAWTWHEAADPRVFYPRHADRFDGDLVWIGNWGDEERTAELHEFLLNPVKRLGLKARVYGVRYPEHALRALADAGIEYGGWLPNHQVPEVFSRFRVTVHIPRRPYASALPGIPTIRVFESLACGIPLISAPWLDAENLFTPGTDFLMARDGDEMQRHLQALLQDGGMRERQSGNGRETILRRHTCWHRVNQLLNIVNEVSTGADALPVAQTAQGGMA
jgi:spore maturation protein CgeB